MKPLLCFLFSFTYFCTALIGQDSASPKATLELSKTEVLSGHSVTVTFTLENVQNARFTPPEWPKNMVVLSGPNQSSQIQVINGAMTSKITYTYLLSVKEAGEVVIGHGKWAVGEKTYTTQAQKIKVLPNPDGIEEVEEKPAARRYDFWGNPVPEPAEKTKQKRPTTRI
jgi:BatD DUF11 like domain